VTQAASGWTVEALKWIRLLPSSMNSRTYSVWSQAVSTLKKAQAMTPWA
jgi:hypothetical protein